VKHSATCRYPDLPGDRCGCIGDVPADPPSPLTDPRLKIIETWLDVGSETGRLDYAELLAALASSPIPAGLEVELLAEAMEAYVMSAKSDPSPWARDFDDIAADLAAEYARAATRPAEEPKHVGPHFVGEFSNRATNRTCPACAATRPAEDVHWTCPICHERMPAEDAVGHLHGEDA